MQAVIIHLAAEERLAANSCLHEIGKNEVAVVGFEGLASVWARQTAAKILGSTDPTLDRIEREILLWALDRFGGTLAAAVCRQAARSLAGRLREPGPPLTAGQLALGDPLGSPANPMLPLT